MGGQGLALPLNDIAWLMVSLGIVLVALWPIKRSTLRMSAAFIWFSGGLFILIIVSCYTRAAWRHDAVLTAAGMAGSLIFYLALLQLKIGSGQRSRILAAVLIAVVLECLLSLLQFLHLPIASGWEFSPLPSARPYGIFQQVNVLASFVATGVAIALWFWFASPSAARDDRLSAFNIALFLPLLLLFGMVLQLCQSQTGYLTALMVVLIYICWYRRQWRGLLLAIGVLMAGGAAGKWLQALMQIPALSHLGESQVRWKLVIYSLRMFSEKPLFGWGAGGFEYSFLQRFSGMTTYVGARTITHPHNEILLWLVEGGLVGLLGVLLILWGGLKLVRLAARRRMLPLLAISLPILLHMMTEYPVYQSVPHWLVLLLIVRCADLPLVKLRSGNAVLWAARGVTGSGAIVLAILLGCSLRLQGQLTQIERQGRQSELAAMPAPAGAILQRDRYLYDLQMGNLLRFNQTGDPRLLVDFERWAARYSAAHPEANIYHIRILIARRLGDPVQQASLLRQARWFFPADDRFSLPATQR